MFLFFLSFKNIQYISIIYLQLIQTIKNLWGTYMLFFVSLSFHLIIKEMHDPNLTCSMAEL